MAPVGHGVGSWYGLSNTGAENSGMFSVPGKNIYSTRWKVPEKRVVKMPEPRKLPPESINESLIGQIVEFTSNDFILIPSGEPVTVMLLVTFLGYYRFDTRFKSDERTKVIKGKFIAGTLQSNDIPYKDVGSYRILTRRELPLYIGYKYTSPLLAELIRGDHEYERL